MHMNVTGHTCPRGCPNIHAEIYAIWLIETTQYSFHVLREVHQLVSGVHGELLQFVQVLEGHDHYVPRRIWIGVEHNVAGSAPVDDARLLVVIELWQVTEYAANRFIFASDIGITPRSPQVIHRTAG